MIRLAPPCRPAHTQLLAASLGLDFKQHISWVYKQGGDSRLKGMQAYSVRMEHLEWFVKPGAPHTFHAEAAAEPYTEAEFNEALEESGEFQQRRREQALAWLWSLVEEGLLASFRSHPAVAETVAGIERDVQALKTTPAAGARVLLERFRSD